MTKKFSADRPLTDAEEADIQRMIASDPDNPEIADEQAKGQISFAEAMKRGRGRPKLDNARQAVTLRLDPETIARFQATGEDWRSRMVEVLDKARI
ncbi:hypothetical protein JP75_05925 [Devosia riboflavina]|uniref:BrnA antitoxin of type II toxin-antitoxin system n=1 Tax=Devosia riboflavina TaxID=46914 RepID=A0A087M4Y0_9HYPH|nr:BrnA antitoxin family protein [Devosia riboflavina]KFL31933.1 hypothetical protein JP75_05925 [Devosia riboflavina]